MVPKTGESFSFKPYKEKKGEEYMNDDQLKHLKPSNDWKAN
jgi:hypothetical protein